MIRPLALILVLSQPAHAATHAFCWTGALDYRIEGTITYPDAAADAPVTEAEVTGFRIVGWRGGEYLGEWSLDDRTPETSFTVNFDPVALAFRMGGDPEGGTYQEWNADGLASDCGDPGFGFNGGNRAQDVCVDGVFVEESGISPDTPLAISPAGAAPCGPVPMSALPPAMRVG